DSQGRSLALAVQNGRRVAWAEIRQHVAAANRRRVFDGRYARVAARGEARLTPLDQLVEAARERSTASGWCRTVVGVVAIGGDIHDLGGERAAVGVRRAGRRRGQRGER